MAKSSTSDIIKLKNVRLSFPHLWKPKAFEEGQTPKYQATFLLDPSNKEHAALISQVKEAAKALTTKHWGEKPAGLKLCFGLADNDEKKAKYNGYPGMWYIAASNEDRPQVYNRRLAPVAETDKQAPYAGCYVNTNITLWTQDNKFAKAIRCNLRIVQFVDDGESFGGAPVVRAEEELELLEDKPAAGVTEVDDFE